MAYRDSSSPLFSQTLTDHCLSEPVPRSIYEDGPELEDTTISRWINPQSVDSFLLKCDAFGEKERKVVAQATIYEEMNILSTQIRDLNRQMVALKRHYNTLNPFLQLPDEILVETWLYLAHDAEFISKSWLSSSRWVRGVTHVCSRWRHLALRSPVLWTWPPVCNSLATIHMLAHAKNRKLTLIVNSQACEFIGSRPSIVSTLKDIGKRSASLIIPLMTLNSFPLLPPPIGSLPLQHIDITYPGPRERQDTRLITFIRATPKLESLHLAGHTIFPSEFRPPHQTVFPGSITDLEIVFDRLGHPQHSSIQTVLKTLSPLTGLKRLVLENVFRPLEEEDVSYCEGLAKQFAFPVLSELTLIAGAPTTQHFIASICHSATAIVKFHGLWREEPFPHTRSIHNVWKTSTLRFDTAITFISLEEIGSRCLAKVHFPCGGSVQFSMPINAAVFLIPYWNNRYQLRYVEEVHYHLKSSNVQIWQLFGVLPGLKRLVVNPCQHPSLLKVLTLIHGSSTIFDPWKMDQCEFTEHEHDDVYYKPGQLYFSHVTFIVPESDRAFKSSFLSHREEFFRISLARRSYRLFLEAAGILRAVERSDHTLNDSDMGLASDIALEMTSQTCSQKHELLGADHRRIRLESLFGRIYTSVY